MEEGGLFSKRVVGYRWIRGRKAGVLYAKRSGENVLADHLNVEKELTDALYKLGVMKDLVVVFAADMKFSIKTSVEGEFMSYPSRELFEALDRLAGQLKDLIQSMK